MTHLQCTSYREGCVYSCADGPVGCWPGGRHAFSTDAGSSCPCLVTYFLLGTTGELPSSEYRRFSEEDYYQSSGTKLLL